MRHRFAVFLMLTLFLFLSDETNAQSQYIYNWVSTTRYTFPERVVVPKSNGNDKYLVAVSYKVVVNKIGVDGDMEYSCGGGVFDNISIQPCWIVVSHYAKSNEVSERNREGIRGVLGGSSAAMVRIMDTGIHNSAVYTSQNMMENAGAFIRYSTITRIALSVFVAASFVYFFAGQVIRLLKRMAPEAFMSEMEHKSLGDRRMPNGRWIKQSTYDERIRRIRHARGEDVGTMEVERIIEEIEGYASDARKDELEGARRIWKAEDISGF